MKSSWQSLIRGFRALSPARRQFLLVTGSLLGLVVLVLQTTNRGGKVDQWSPAVASNQAIGTTSAVPLDARIDLTKEAMTAVPPMAYKAPFVGALNIEAGPRITYSAELSVVTKEFARARSSMEDILERHRGYTAKLRMAGQQSGSTLSATLRVPATEYRTALAELKSLGEVERDEEAADEIAQQHGHLEARLQNAQNNERHLQQLLKDRFNQAASALAPIERQLSLLRGEIERMEAEQRAYDDRAVFSNIYFSLREEKMLPVESFGAEIRGAAITGFSGAFHSLLVILVFCVNYGPSLLLWATFLFFPVRMLWRRYQRAQSLASSVSA